MTSLMGAANGVNTLADIMARNSRVFDSFTSDAMRSLGSLGLATNPAIKHAALTSTRTLPTLGIKASGLDSILRTSKMFDSFTSDAMRFLESTADLKEELQAMADSPVVGGVVTPDRLGEIWLQEGKQLWRRLNAIPGFRPLAAVLAMSGVFYWWASLPLEIREDETLQPMLFALIGLLCGLVATPGKH